MNYTEYTFERFDPATGTKKVRKWIDGASVDFLDYTVNKNKDYQLSLFEIKSLVFNFMRGEDTERILGILSTAKLNCEDLWNVLLEYNIHSNHNEKIIDLAKFLLNNNLLPNFKQTISLIAMESEELNKLLTEVKRDLKFSELKFNDYCTLVGTLKPEQMVILETLGFKRNPDWDTTINTLKENNVKTSSYDRLPVTYNYPRLNFFDTFFEDPIFNSPFISRPRMLSIL